MSYVYYNVVLLTPPSFQHNPLYQMVKKGCYVLPHAAKRCLYDNVGRIGYVGLLHTTIIACSDADQYASSTRTRRRVDRDRRGPTVKTGV